MSKLGYLSLISFFIFVNIQLSFSQAPILTLQTGHDKAVNDISYSKDGRFVATCSSDNTIKLWDTKSGKEIKTFIGHSQSVKCLDFSEDGKYLISGGNKKDHSIILWDLKTGEKVRVISDFTGDIIDVSLSRDGEYCAVAEVTTGFESIVKVYNIRRGELMYVLDKPKNFYVRSLDISPDSRQLVLGGKDIKKKRDNNISIWNLRDGENITTFKGTSYDVNSVAFSHENYLVLSGGVSIDIWDVRSAVIEKKVPGSSACVGFSGWGKYIAIGKGKEISLWNILDNKVDWVKNTLPSPVSALQVDPESKYIAVGLKNGDLRLFDMRSGESVPYFEKVKTDKINFVSFYNYKDIFTAVDGQNIVKIDGEAARMKLYNEKPKQKKRYNVTAVDFSPNNRRMLVTANSKKGLDVWDLKYNEHKDFYKNSSLISKGKFSSDEKYIAACSKDKTVRVWKKGQEEVLYVLKGHTAYVNDIAFSADNTKIYSVSSDKTLRVWDLATGTQTMMIETFKHPINAISVSKNGKFLVTGGGDLKNVNSTTTELKVFDLSNFEQYKGKKGNEPLTLTGHTKAISAVAINSYENMIASAGADNKIIIYDNEGNKKNELLGHSALINSIEFSDNSKQLISGSNDGRLKMWDVLTGKNQINIINFDNGKDYIIYTDDNYYTCSPNGTKAVHFVKDNKEVFLFEQFDLKLNRPDLVLSKFPNANPHLVKAYNKAYKKRLKKMGFTEEMLGDDFHVPVAKIVNDTLLPYLTEERWVEIEVNAYDDLYNLDRINVWINDVPIFGKGGISLRSKNTKAYQETIKLELSEGKNKIQVSALNQKGAESFKQTKYMFYNKKAKHDLYVISIGVSDYVDDELDLGFAEKDANDIKNLFGKSTQFNQIHTKVIANKEATKENITQTKSFLKNSQVNDYVIVFVASHGLLNKNLDYFIGTTDVDAWSPEKRGLPYDDLEGILDGIPARNKLLMIDACHSGEVDKDEELDFEESPTSNSNDQLADATVKTRGFKTIKSASQVGLKDSYELMKELFADLRRGSGSIVISAAGGLEFALESVDFDNGAFTASVIEGITSKNADLNKDGEIVVSELREYVSERVVSLTKGQQHPTSRAVNLENDFVIWKE